MSEQQEEKPRYMVSVYEAKDPPGAFLFTFVPRGLQTERGAGGPPARVPQYILLATPKGRETELAWGPTSDDPKGARAELEQEALKRLAERAEWIDRVSALVAQVEDWARRLGWATRRIEKKLDDSYVGKHTVPALLMQEETIRVLLEPVARTAPGASGLVDLYLMPGYDDIASLYLREGSWRIHYLFPGDKPVGTLKDAEARPLDPDTLSIVLGEMKKHGR